jgi:prepilin-type N-terminal cleavage/methylation domain-containing protein
MFMNTGTDRMAPWRGFTLVELVVAMIILAVLLMPLVKHFVSTRRVSIAARDSVVANAQLLSCMADFQAMRVDEIANVSNATFTKVFQRWDGDRTVGSVTYHMVVNVNAGADPRYRLIEVETQFRMPGAPSSAPKRKMTIKGFTYAPPN